MMHNVQGLYDELHRAHIEINKQIEAEKDNYAKEQEINKWLADVDIYHAHRPDGYGILNGLLASKAQILSGMAALKAADVASKAPRR